MPRSLSFSLLGIFFLAYSASAQSQDTGSSQTPPPAQNSTAPADAKKPKKVWTNENMSDAGGSVSVVGDAKGKPKPGASSPVNETYVAATRKQLEKLRKQTEDLDKQIGDLKNFSAGDSSNDAVGRKLGKAYNREPLEVQIRTLQDKKKDLQTQIDALLDEARKKGVEPGRLR